MRFLQNTVHGVLKTGGGGVETEGHTFQTEESVLRNNADVVETLGCYGQIVESCANVQRAENRGALQLIQNCRTVRDGMMGGCNARVRFDKVNACPVIPLRLPPLN